MRNSSNNKKPILLHIAAITCALVFSTPDNTFASDKEKSGKGKKPENVITAFVHAPTPTQALLLLPTARKEQKAR